MSNFIIEDGLVVSEGISANSLVIQGQDIVQVISDTVIPPDNDTIAIASSYNSAGFDLDVSTVWEDTWGKHPAVTASLVNFTPSNDTVGTIMSANTTGNLYTNIPEIQLVIGKYYLTTNSNTAFSDLEVTGSGNNVPLVQIGTIVVDGVTEYIWELDLTINIGGPVFRANGVTGAFYFRLWNGTPTSTQSLTVDNLSSITTSIGTTANISGSAFYGDGSQLTGIASLANIVDSISGSQTGVILGDINNNVASGNFALAEGERTTSLGTGSHAEGIDTTAMGNYSHAEGNNTTVLEGIYGNAFGTGSHAEGRNTVAQHFYYGGAHAEGWNTFARGDGTHAEGSYTTASYQYSHAEGINTTASGQSSHAEGSNTTASGQSSHTEGYRTTASGGNSHAEGNNTKASDSASHAEGWRTTASGEVSHAEGTFTTASGFFGAHAEGYRTTASGWYSHAEGRFTTAGGDTTHASGELAKATHNNSSVWSDGTEFFSQGTQTFNVHATNGIYLSGGPIYGDGSNLTGIGSTLTSVDGLSGGEIIGDLSATGNISGSAFYGDGSNLTGVTHIPGPVPPITISGGSFTPTNASHERMYWQNYHTDNTIYLPDDLDDGLSFTFVNNTGNTTTVGLSGSSVLKSKGRTRIIDDGGIATFYHGISGQWLGVGDLVI